MADRKETSDEALDSSLRSLKKFALPNQFQKSANALIAKNVLQTDLGQFADKPPDYRLSEVSKDALLAHARQDAAHALLNTADILAELKAQRGQLRALTLGVVVLLVIVVIALWKLGIRGTVA